MNYLMMDRASEAAANDLAEVRKLIEGMNALVNSQIQQQQQQQQAQLQAQQQQHLHLQYSQYLIHDQQQQETAMMAATLAAVTEHQQYLNVSPSPSSSLQQTTNADMDSSQQEQSKSVNDEIPQEPPKEQSSTASPKPVKTKKASKNTTSLPSSTRSETAETTATSAAPATDTPADCTPSSQAGVIVEVIHLTFNRVLYFQLAEDATIEPMIAWLRLSYQDAAISGMVLQYKGFDGLWKCLLNRDDSLRRILKQSMKGNTMLQMRVPREQDLLSSGYTDRRLLALTKTECMYSHFRK